MAARAGTILLTTEEREREKARQNQKQKALITLQSRSTVPSSSKKPVEEITILKKNKIRSTNGSIDKNNAKKRQKVEMRREKIKYDALCAKIPATAWDELKKRNGCVRMKKDTHPILNQVLQKRMKAVLSRAIVMSDTKIVQPGDILMAVESLGSSVAT